MEARRRSSLKFTEEILQRGRANSEVVYNYTGPKNTIKSLVNPKHGLCDEEIREEINSIIMAVSKIQIIIKIRQLIMKKYFQGQETSAITVSSVLLLLAMHKSIQHKVVDELKQLFTSVNDPIDFESLNQLTYLELVIKETMRLFPVAAFTLRTTTENFELQKYTIPAGANLFLSIFTLHRDKTYWGDDADMFIPERFEAERIKNIHPYAYVPFTGET